MTTGLTTARASLAKNSKSFALAGKLLPVECRDDAAVVYAYCRRVDDEVDEVAVSDPQNVVHALERQLDDVYAGATQSDPVLAAFQDVVQRRRIPKDYPRELIAGMATDAVRGPLVYRTCVDLDLYCYRVAGTVGLMMCHVMGVRDDRALRNAAHLGMAMQLTNICRDVAEDWTRGRLYVPLELLPASLPQPHAGDAFPAVLAPAFADALPALLDKADTLYASGDAGVPALSYRCAVAIRTARLVYAAIGDELRARAHDVTAGRAVVPTTRKLRLAARALCAESVARLASYVRLPARRPFAIPSAVVRYPDDVAHR